ncbi:MAG TPA: fatty acid desaturase, partial [Polyangiaceae bacterium]|nr:fatty acid desaturase [Polyangiaceae bacterium]
LRTLGFVASFFIGVYTLWIGALPWWAAIPVYGWVLLMAAVAAVINHNALHTPVFRARWANRVFQIVLSFIYGAPVSIFVPVHNHSHHKYSQTPKDVTRSWKLRSRFNLINTLRAASVIGAGTLRDDIRYFKVQRRKGAAIWSNLKIEGVGLLAYAITLLVLDWKNFLWLVFLPWQVSQGFIVGINYVQHDGCDPDNDGYDFARNFSGGPFNWVFLNNGFHTVHHLHPGLHWSKTPAAHDELVAPHIHPNLVAENAAVFFWHYFFAPGTRQTHLGEPYSPPPAGEDEPWFYDLDETYSAADPAE